MTVGNSERQLFAHLVVPVAIRKRPLHVDTGQADWVSTLVAYTLLWLRWRAAG